jgi:pre-mRNA-splicing factor CDC5/CEF1
MLTCDADTAAWLQGNAVRKTSASNTMRLDAAKREHQATRGEMEVQARRAAKLDKKANILITGLQQRDTKLRTQLDDLAQQVRLVVQTVLWAMGKGGSA